MKKLVNPGSSSDILAAPTSPAFVRNFHTLFVMAEEMFTKTAGDRIQFMIEELNI